MKTTSTTYQIYGRKAYETPLTLVGEITIEAAQPLQQRALEHVGADGWVELVVIPHDAMIYVTEKDKS